MLRVKQLGADYFLPNIAISITQRTLYKLVYSIVEAAVGSLQRRLVSTDCWLIAKPRQGSSTRNSIVSPADCAAARPGRKIGAHERPAFLGTGGFEDEPEIHAGVPAFPPGPRPPRGGFRPLPSDLAGGSMAGRREPESDAGFSGGGPRRKGADAQACHGRNRAASYCRGLPEALRFSVQELLRLARVYTALDDIEHYQTTRLTLAFRKGLRALGETLRPWVWFRAHGCLFCHGHGMDDAVHRNDKATWAHLATKSTGKGSAYLKNHLRSPEWELGKPAPVLPSREGALRFTGQSRHRARQDIQGALFR